MACPFFMPEQRFDVGLAVSAAASPGRGMGGHCTAPGHEGARPGEEELKSGCNLGYAKSCSRLPAERHADAVRFVLGEERDGILRVLFVCERAYLPAGHGELLYDKGSGTGCRGTMIACVQRMAECYVQAQMAATGGRPTATLSSCSNLVTYLI